MLERCGYRTALYLSALIAAVNWELSNIFTWYLPHPRQWGIEFTLWQRVVILIGLLGY